MKSEVKEIRDLAVSSFKDGIETLHVPIVEPFQLVRLNAAAKEGLSGIIEWLQYEFLRSPYTVEPDRVCGFRVEEVADKQIRSERSVFGNVLILHIEQRRPDWVLREVIERLRRRDQLPTDLVISVQTNGDVDFGYDRLRISGRAWQKPQSQKESGSERTSPTGSTTLSRGVEPSLAS